MIGMIGKALSGLGAAATPPQGPQLAISLGNQPLDDQIAACVLDLSVDQTIDQADHLSLRLATWNPDTGKTLWIDDDRFSPGTGLAVKLGYGQSLAPAFELLLRAITAARRYRSRTDTLRLP